MQIRPAYHPATFLHGKKPVRPKDFLGACRALRAIGWRGIEYSAGAAASIWPNPHDYRRDLESVEMSPVTLYTPYGVTRAEEISEAVERAKKAFEYVAGAGCEFSLLDGGQHHEGEDGDEETRVLAECANQLARAAQQAGLHGVWHQHFGTVIELPPQFHLFMQLVDPNVVEFCPDTAQLTLGGIDCEDAFRRYLPRITYVHFKDLDEQRRMRETGGGCIDFKPLAAMLTNANYSGWVTPDLDYTTDMTAEEAARRSYRALQALFP